MKAFPFLLIGVVPMVQLDYLADEFQKESLGAIELVISMARLAYLVHEYLRGFLVVFVYWVSMELFVSLVDEFRKEFQFSIADVELKEIYVF